jgi:hypothetical protein
VLCGVVLCYVSRASNKDEKMSVCVQNADPIGYILAKKNPGANKKNRFY